MFNRDKIIIQDLAAQCRVGVPDTERANPQKLLISLELHTDFTRASANDELHLTIDYFAVCQAILCFCEGKEWKLLEKLANDLAAMILQQFHPTQVKVVIKKFILPETAYVAVEVSRP